MTFAELSMLMQAYSDAAEMQQGHDPFLTAEQARADRDYLIRVAKERQNGKG